MVLLSVTMEMSLMYMSTPIEAMDGHLAVGGRVAMNKYFGARGLITLFQSVLFQLPWRCPQCT